MAGRFRNRRVAAVLAVASMLIAVPSLAHADAQIVCTDDQGTIVMIVSANDRALHGFETAAAAVTPQHERLWGITCTGQPGS